MRVALTVWENRISPLFDSSRMLLLVDIGERRVTDRHYEPFHCRSPYSGPKKLADLEVKVLICGAVTDWFANFIETYGIQLIPFVRGTVDEVLEAYLTDALSRSKFLMPGCDTKRDRGFREKK